MHAESTATGDQNLLNDFRRLFYTHIGTVILTAALVVPLLLGVASIPSWISVTYCVVIVAVAIAFVAASIRALRYDSGVPLADRLQCVVLTLSLSLLQAIFVLPVLICIFAPTFRA